ncbi:hypothetical protein SJ05684_c05880 [Sinorhizobium sojae CCBAU 05684]|uniref:Uncharacterized protein n=1 Tax=Sinorhizobium sojae CCBAU 05684 TaxID=716928 RepID=A0A249P8I6_9HYPH|nr:hypothetical protein [Sinorhizobium sojae]ASY62052.1 hypothetical protein SJ05684_c05880 [Sinorhizobium sojae CCBAU 05684]
MIDFEMTIAPEWPASPDNGIGALSASLPVRATLVAGQRLTSYNKTNDISMAIGRQMSASIGKIDKWR